MWAHLKTRLSSRIRRQDQLHFGSSRELDFPVPTQAGRLLTCCPVAFPFIRIQMSSTPTTRPSLLIRVRDADDRDAWDEFVELYTPMIFSYATRRGLQQADAADLAQDVMLSVARSIGRFQYDRQIGAFRAWLFRVTGNRLRTLMNQKQRRAHGSGDSRVQRLLAEIPASEDESLWQTEYKKRIFEWAVNKVRVEFRSATFEAFEQTALQQQPAAQVAAALNVSVGAVYIARSRVTARIREVISEVEAE